ncbi:CDP-glycerol glycerophosphotransferase family protein [Brachybacterium squillarum]|uniref:CDP-glycerol glycerophosphotransferase family protein n=1 Tax=Brachybacterium squillarum TaxID=661979 RepID=UPI0002629580|nr:CDP-glycerol glycerophosphotransferase family protein [Brachybacterium squillarum]
MSKRSKKVQRALRIVNFWSIVANLLGIAAVLGAALAPQTWISLVLLLLPLALITYRQRKTLLRRPRGVGGITRYFTARYLVLAAGVVHLVAAEELTALSVVIAVLAAAGIELERLLRTLHGIAAPYAFHLPDRATRNKAAFRYGYLFPASLIGLALFVIAPLLPPWFQLVPLAVTAGALVFGAFALADVVARIRARRRFQAEIGEVLEQIGPVFYLYWHAEARSQFQVKMWLPYLERIGVPFAVIVRTATNLREVAAITDRPVLLRRSLKDLDPVVVPSLKAVFYVNNGVRNNHMIRYSQLTHIQLLHGESDKAASVNPVMRMFDRDFVAGQAAIDRFGLWGIDMPPEIFRIVGRPQVEDVEPARGPIGSLEQKTVLYAPTWRGYQKETDYSSLLVGPQMVRALLERGATVVFRPHPYSYRDPELRAACTEIKRMLEEDAAATGREHLWGRVAEKDLSIFECFNASDAMISDVSSVVGDYLHSRKPFAMVATTMDAEEFVAQFPTSRAAYVLDGSLDNLEALLDELLATDTMRARREELATYYLGDIPRENYAQRFVDVARGELGVTEEDLVMYAPALEEEQSESDEDADGEDEENGEVEEPGEDARA